MDRRKGLFAGIILAVASASMFYFFMYPLYTPGGQSDNPFSDFNQNPADVPTLTNDVDTCMSTPSSDCDQEMLQISKFCQQNKGSNIPVCSDARVQQYIDMHGLARPAINTGQ